MSCIAVFDYIQIILLISSGASSVISIDTVVGAPIGITCASISLAFPPDNVILQMYFKKSVKKEVNIEKQLVGYEKPQHHRKTKI